MQNLGPCAQIQRPSETVSSKRAISALTKEELIDEIVSLGERSFRADQIRDWLYKKNVQSFEEMANIPKALRTELKKRLLFRTLNLRRSLRSGDGTTKFLFELMDGLLIESVLIPEKDHMTLCISSQVGCAMGCIFCLTGKGGFKRNLTPHEIVDQVLEVKRWAPKRPAITNIVFMGMGEPLLNLEGVIKAVRILIDPEALSFSHRRVTVSTSGIIPGILRLGQGLNVNLAVSLNAPSEDLRSHIMPINKRYPLKELMETLAKYPLQKGRRITFEYVLIRDLNDREEHAQRLAKLVKGIPCKVNLIPLNEVPGSDLRPPEEEDLNTFQKILFEANITAIVRKSKGKDIMAACGQLAGLYGL